MSFVLAILVDHATAIQAGLFGGVITATWWIEARRLGHEGGRKQRRTRTNALFVLCALPLQLMMAGLCVQAALWSADQGWGLLRLLPWHDSGWVKYGLMFLLLDLLDWVYHYLMHHVPVLWRFHLVHHTDQAIDVSTTVREHPGETVARNGFLIGWVLLTGASLELLVLRQTVETVSNILAHTTFRLRAGPDRVLGWLLITPNLHHVHHHRLQPYTDRNFGDVFSLWDRLFGTYAALPREAVVFGLDTHADPAGDDGFVRALAMPFDLKPGGLLPVREPLEAA
ncbi:MAG: sterol desaturase family protein [Methylobacterium sp.]|nr:MAG: sterol desaturase family protein [Methylobacterium sp.]